MDFDLLIAGIFIGAAGTLGVISLAIVIREIANDARERRENEERENAAWRQVARNLKK